MEHFNNIVLYVIRSFINIWPYLLVTIPLAVGLQLSGVSKHLDRVMGKNPVVSVLLATMAGALSPFCSCGVIPVIASLLIGGVPLAPVMAFWIASPSMDPEIFLLSVASIGLELSVWRLAATFGISLMAGLLTHYAVMKGFIGPSILRAAPGGGMTRMNAGAVKKLVTAARERITLVTGTKSVILQLQGIKNTRPDTAVSNCCVQVEQEVKCCAREESRTDCGCSGATKPIKNSFTVKLLKESRKAFLMVTKFMTLAFVLNALITFYLPEDSVSGLLGGESPYTVLVAALVGIPFYTSNITALPLVGGLLSLGMNPGAALAFLVSGPVTTLPAMAAVYGIVKPRIFLLYLLFSLTGAIVAGYLFVLVS